ncbi:DUF952 domain-containing protein [Bacteriovoracaceae bacterium]|nr:DUF952 domain-containing protein [Bacteriovoracaceae bacterium]
MENHFIYHITQSSLDDISKQGHYEHPSLAEEGFIHFSTSEQIHRVYQNFYSDLNNLIILQVNVEKLEAELIYEKADDLNDFFPHLYGKLNLEAINNYLPYDQNENYPNH